MKRDKTHPPPPSQMTPIFHFNVGSFVVFLPTVGFLSPLINFDWKSSFGASWENKEVWRSKYLHDGRFSPSVTTTKEYFSSGKLKGGKCAEGIYSLWRATCLMHETVYGGKRHMATPKSRMAQLLRYLFRKEEHFPPLALFLSSKNNSSWCKALFHFFFCSSKYYAHVLSSMVIRFALPSLPIHVCLRVKCFSA